MPSSNILLWLLPAAAGLLLLPAELQTKVRSVVGDAVQPGAVAVHVAAQWLERSMIERGDASESATDELQRLRLQLAETGRRMHRLEVQSARWNESAPAFAAPLFRSDRAAATDRLLEPKLLEAAVLGDAHAAGWRAGRWLGAGKTAGLYEDGVILSSKLPLIDVGRESPLSAEDALVSGRSVIGKVHHVGRWTSTFRLVTDAEFRDRVQLAHETESGYVFGAKGILKGQGEALCRLDGIPASETVEAGDLVYSAGRDGVMPTPWYYGRVVGAALDDSAREWRIEVEPVAIPSDLTTVYVLSTALNENRLAN